MTLSAHSSRVSTAARRRSTRRQTGTAPRWLSILALVSWVMCGWPGVQDVYAQTGDFIVVRGATAGDTITTENSFATLDWDTTVKDEGAGRPTLSGGNQILLDAGHHLVLYSIKATGPFIDRSAWASRLQLAGSPLAYGYGGAYARNSEALVTGISFGGALINVASAGDALALQWARQDTTGSNVTRDANASGLQVLKLDDTLDYLRIREVGGGQDFDTTTFTSINWDTSDETDTASFGFTAASTNITLKGASGKLFLVFANMGMDTGTNLRANTEMAFFLDGSELTGSRVTAYGRDANVAGSANETWLSGAFLVAKTSASDQTLTVRARREDTNTVAITNVGGETALSIVALPDGAEAIRLTNSTAENLNAVGPEVFNWDTEDEEDTAAFTHDTVTNNSRITVDVADDYLFFVQAHSSITALRVRPWLRFRKNGGSDLTYAMASRHGRGADGADNAGMWAGNIFEDLVTNDYVEATHTRDSTATPTYNSDQLYFWGLRIGSLVGGPSAALTGTLSDNATEA